MSADHLGRVNAVKIRIGLELGNGRPIRLTPYHQTPEEVDFEYVEVGRMLSEEVIEQAQWK